MSHIKAVELSTEGEVLEVEACAAAVFHPDPFATKKNERKMVKKSKLTDDYEPELHGKYK